MVRLQSTSNNYIAAGTSAVGKPDGRVTPPPPRIEVFSLDPAHSIQALHTSRVHELVQVLFWKPFVYRLSIACRPNLHLYWFHDTMQKKNVWRIPQKNRSRPSLLLHLLRPSNYIQFGPNNRARTFHGGAAYFWKSRAPLAWNLIGRSSE